MKRKAGHQLTKDDDPDKVHPEDVDDVPADTPEMIAQRRMVRARRHGVPAANESASASTSTSTSTEQPQEEKKADEAAKPAPKKTFSWNFSATKSKDEGDKEAKKPAGFGSSPSLDSAPSFGFKSGSTLSSFASLGGSFAKGGSSTASPFGSSNVSPFGNTKKFGSSSSLGSSTESSIIGTDAPAPEGPTKELELKEVPTGEEDEEVLCKIAPARLFKLSPVPNSDDPSERQWKERGKGELHVNKNKKTDAYRIVMRMDTTKRLILNTSVFAKMKVERPTDKSIRFSGMEYEEQKGEQPKTVLAWFALRVRTKEVANDLVQKLEEIRIKLGGEPSDAASGLASTSSASATSSDSAASSSAPSASSSASSSTGSSSASPAASPAASKVASASPSASPAASPAKPSAAEGASVTPKFGFGSSGGGSVKGIGLAANFPTTFGFGKSAKSEEPEKAKPAEEEKPSEEKAVEKKEDKAQEEEAEKKQDEAEEKKAAAPQFGFGSGAAKPAKSSLGLQSSFPTGTKFGFGSSS